MKVLYKILYNHLLKIMIQRLLSKRNLFFKTNNHRITFTSEMMISYILKASSCRVFTMEIWFFKITSVKSSWQTNRNLFSRLDSGLWRI